MSELFTVTLNQVMGVVWLVMWVSIGFAKNKNGFYNYWSQVFGTILGVIAGVGFALFAL